jgi:hypothetical protein
MKNVDDSFTGIVGRVQAQGSSWEGAKNQVVAEVEDRDAAQYRVARAHRIRSTPSLTLRRAKAK